MAKSLVHKANQWAGEDCEREDCMVCRWGEEHKGDCRRRNIVYKTECRDCKGEAGERSKKKDTLYVGETSRTGYERGQEHQRDAKSKAKTENSHIRIHQVEAHGGETGNGFSMKVVRGHKSALARQVHEAVLIANCQSQNLLNSKAEYNRCIIPRLAVMVGTKEKGEEETVGEREALEYEEGMRSRKREDEQGLHNQRAKRRKRWKEEPKVMKEKRQAKIHQEGEIRYMKRRRIDDLRSLKTQTSKQPRISSLFHAIEKPDMEVKSEAEPSVAKCLSVAKPSHIKPSEKDMEAKSEAEPSVTKCQSVAKPSLTKPSKKSLESEEHKKRGVYCNTVSLAFLEQVKTPRSKPKIKKSIKSAVKKENFSPTRKKLLEMGKIRDIRSFF